MLGFWCNVMASFLFQSCFCSEFRFIEKEGDISFLNIKTSSATKGQVFSKHGALLSKKITSSVEQCWLRCVQSKDCLSVNVISLDQSKYQCDLLNWAGSGFGKHLLAKANATFIQAYTVCDLKNPCKNGGECVAEDGGTNYTCVCSSIAVGRHCERPSKCTFFDFENGTLDGWTLTGTAFNNQPTYGDRKNTSMKGNWKVDTYENRPSPSHPAKHQGDSPKGTATSPPFVIVGTKLKFLLGGHQTEAYLELLIGGNVVDRVSPTHRRRMTQKEMDVTSYRYQTARVRLVDNSSGGWGYVMADQIENTCDN